MVDILLSQTLYIIVTSGSIVLAALEATRKAVGYPFASMLRIIAMK